MNTHTFKFGCGLQFILWVGLLLSTFMMIVSSLLPWIEQVAIEVAAVMSIFFGGFALLFIYAICRMRGIISVDEGGITRTCVRGRTARIAWDEVGVVDESGGQVLIIRDKLRTRRIDIESLIDGFDMLREIILARAPAVTEFSVDQLPLIFPRTRCIYIPIFMFALFGAAVGHIAPFGKPMLPVGLSSVALFIGCFIIWHSIEASLDGLTYRYCFGRFRKIPIKTIADSHLASLSTSGPYGEPGRVAQVVVVLNDGTTITIMGVRGGTMALHVALQAAIEFHRGKQSSNLPTTS